MKKALVFIFDPKMKFGGIAKARIEKWEKKNRDKWNNIILCDRPYEEDVLEAVWYWHQMFRGWEVVFVPIGRWIIREQVIELVMQLPRAQINFWLQTSVENWDERRFLIKEQRIVAQDMKIDAGDNHTWGLPRSRKKVYLRLADSEIDYHNSLVTAGKTKIDNQRRLIWEQGQSKTIGWQGEIWLKNYSQNLVAVDLDGQLKFLLPNQEICLI